MGFIQRNMWHLSNRTLIWIIPNEIIIDTVHHCFIYVIHIFEFSSLWVIKTSLLDNFSFSHSISLAEWNRAFCLLFTDVGQSSSLWLIILWIVRIRIHMHSISTECHTIDNMKLPFIWWISLYHRRQQWRTLAIDVKGVSSLRVNLMRRSDLSLLQHRYNLYIIHIVFWHHRGSTRFVPDQPHSLQRPFNWAEPSSIPSPSMHLSLRLNLSGTELLYNEFPSERSGASCGHRDFIVGSTL